jgi:hypothetical protein
VALSQHGTSATAGPITSATVLYECGVVAGMRTGRGNRII